MCYSQMQLQWSLAFELWLDMMGEAWQFTHLEANKLGKAVEGEKGGNILA